LKTLLVLILKQTIVVKY